MKKSVKKVITGAICIVAISSVLSGTMLTSAKSAEKSSAVSPSSVSATVKSNTKYITVNEAKKKALADAGVKAKDATFKKAKLDKDNGVAVYEIEFVTAKKKYDYEINAKTGKIREKEVEKLPQKNSKSNSKQTSSKNITAAEAKKIALSDAKVAAKDATFKKAKLDKDNGVAVYDIEFVTANKEYDYEINAKTGKIREKDVENLPQKKTSNGSSSAIISIDQAKKIALNHAGLKASEVKFIKAKLEKDNGRYEYEIEFVKGRYEYSYEINAKTQKIIDFEKEIDN